MEKHQKGWGCLSTHGDELNAYVGDLPIEMVEILKDPMNILLVEWLELEPS